MSKMKKYLNNFLYKDCLILPFENEEGKIVGVHLTKNGLVYSVRYFLNGDYRIEDFFDFDIEVLEDSE